MHTICSQISWIACDSYNDYNSANIYSENKDENHYNYLQVIIVIVSNFINVVLLNLSYWV